MSVHPAIPTFRIGNRLIGAGQPALIIAEIAQAHDGSLGLAHAYIDAVAKAGADAVKFQTHIAAAESTPAEPWRVRFSRQDETRYEYWRRMEFTEPQWRDLKQHAEELGLLFLSSPFSDEAIELLERHNMLAWKLASGEVNNPLLLDRILQTGRPVLISSGMSSLDELDQVVASCHEQQVPCALFQCTTAYPCPAEKVGLNLIPEFRARYHLPIGLSDHSGTIFPSLAAATLGIEMLEVHVTMSREMFGPDVSSSVTTAELKQLVEGVRFIECARANPCNKDAAAGELLEMRDTFGKSLVLRTPLPAGSRLDRTHLTAKKLGRGLPSSRMDQVVGRTLVRFVAADEPLTEELLDCPRGTCN